MSTSADDPATVIESAGALVWRVRDGGLQVQLIHRPRYDDWSWPKGKVDPGEALPTTAAREVTEETGKPVSLGLPLPGLEYLTPEGRVKRVHYWAATRVHSRSPAVTARAPVPPVDPAEIDDVRWLGVDEAAGRLTRAADRIPLEALIEEHEKGRLATTALVVARHGKALARTSWHGDEASRPLTPTGHAQSAALVPVLAAFGVDAVVTSRWRRCADTIEPYSRAARLESLPSEYVTEADHERSPSRVAALIRALLEAGAPSLLCTHRPVLPTVLDVLGQHSRRSVASALPTKDPYLEPGEALVTHVTQSAKGPRVVGVEKVLPPLH
ncbi:NUDIX hydrolase [Sanguibacter suaedae]|uniref:NUDIX hydrolase n=1 Tax=Sanguibacter suaedae TaxID=2795737 RepID=UPI0027DD69A1|nr:NUDIX domain-containing protein [Sanguibacter suaedae]